MNTKVEEALGVLDWRSIGNGCTDIARSRTTLAAHIAQQGATIARLREALADLNESCHKDRATIRAALNQGEG